MQEAGEHALFALEDLSLRIEQQLSTGQRKEPITHLGQLIKVGRAAGLEAGEAAFHLSAPAFVPLDLEQDLLHEHVDLGVLALDAPDVLLDLTTQP